MVTQMQSNRTGSKSMYLRVVVIVGLLLLVVAVKNQLSKLGPQSELDAPF